MSNALRMICVALPLAALAIAARPATAGKDGDAKVAIHKDIDYHGGKEADKERHRLDIYAPEGGKDLPVLLHVHGGGWTKGNKLSFAKQGEMLAGKRIVVLSTNYRLSPAGKHPAHAQDGAKAIAWTKQNIAKYGGNPAKLFLSGHSAGGHLVALVATDESYLKAEKMSLSDLRGVIPIAAPYVIRPGKNPAFGTEEELCKQASPQTHARAG